MGFFMRRVGLSLAVLALAGGAAAAGPLEDDFAGKLAGPWGRVDMNWQPYFGALAKNSCPADGVRGPSTIGLFGDGGAMWVEAIRGGVLKWHEGSLVRTLSFVRLESSTAAVYNELGVERRLTLAADNRLQDVRLPEDPTVPPAQYARCKVRK